MIETKLRDERSMTQMNKIEVSTITLVDPLTNGLVMSKLQHASIV